MTEMPRCPDCTAPLRLEWRAGRDGQVAWLVCSRCEFAEASRFSTGSSSSSMPPPDPSEIPVEQPPPKAIRCRKCGWPIMSGEYRFGSKLTGWEHMEGECMSPVIDPDEPSFRELTDSEQAAEDATWD